MQGAEESSPPVKASCSWGTDEEHELRKKNKSLNNLMQYMGSCCVAQATVQWLFSSTIIAHCSLKNLTLSPRLECSGVISIQCNPYLLGSKTGFFHVAQACLKLLSSRNPPTLPPKVLGLQGCFLAQLLANDKGLDKHDVPNHICWGRVSQRRVIDMEKDGDIFLIPTVGAYEQKSFLNVVMQQHTVTIFFIIVIIIIASTDLGAFSVPDRGMLGGFDTSSRRGQSQSRSQSTTRIEVSKCANPGWWCSSSVPLDSKACSVGDSPEDADGAGIVNNSMAEARWLLWSGFRQWEREGIERHTSLSQGLLLNLRSSPPLTFHSEHRQTFVLLPRLECSGMITAQLTAASISWAQVILRLQPPEEQG
ncbi:hypothetical protein AAY473_035869, partial [Plecturocebus cupreus]